MHACMHVSVCVCVCVSERNKPMSSFGFTYKWRFGSGLKHINQGYCMDIYAHKLRIFFGSICITENMLYDSVCIYKFWIWVCINQGYAVVFCVYSPRLYTEFACAGNKVMHWKFYYSANEPLCCLSIHVHSHLMHMVQQPLHKK